MKGETYYRLTDECIAAIRSKKRDGFTKEAFLAFARSEREPCVSMADGAWKDALSGMSIPTDQASCFTEFLAKFGYQPSGPLVEVAERQDTGSWLGTAIDSLASFAAKNLFLGEPNSYCQNRDDYDQAAEMALRWIGWNSSGGSVLGPDAALEAGITVMRRGVRQLSGWLEWLCSTVDKNIVAFTIVRGRRVSVSVVIPLSRVAGDAFAAGALSDVDFTLGHLDVPAKDILFWMMAEANPPVGGSRWRHALAQFSTTIQQTAALTVRGTHEEIRYLSIAGTPQSRKRLEESGFRPTGGKLPGFDRDLYAFDGRTDQVDKNAAFRYGALSFALKLAHYEFSAD